MPEAKQDRTEPDIELMRPPRMGGVKTDIRHPARGYAVQLMSDGGEAIDILAEHGDYLALNYREWVRLLQAAQDGDWEPCLDGFAYLASDGARVTAEDAAALAKGLRAALAVPSRQREADELKALGVTRARFGKRTPWEHCLPRLAGLVEDVAAFCERGGFEVW